MSRRTRESRERARAISPDVSSTSWRERLRKPHAVGGSVLLVYGLWLLFSFHAGHPPRDFLFLGSTFLDQSHSSVAISNSDAARHVLTDIGYDGQFVYYIAVDPVNARYYMKSDTGGGPGYRYGRILYAMTARLLAFGQGDLIPYTMLLINWLALGLGTTALAAWLRRKEVSPWLALLFGLYPGLFISLHKDLTEPMSNALVALAIYVFNFGGRRRIFWAGVCLGLAVLTRETAAIFVVAYGLALLVQGGRVRENWRRARLFLGLALAPFALYEIFLRLWLGSTLTSSQNAFQVIPLQSVFAYWPWQGEQLDEVFSVVVPGLLCGGMALWALSRRVGSVEVWALILNVLTLVILTNPVSYTDYLGAGRITGVVVLAAIYCIPVFQRLVGWNRSWLWISSILWFAPWYTLVPLAINGPWVGFW